MKLLCWRVFVSALLGAMVGLNAAAGAEPLVEIPARDEKQIALARGLTITRASLPADVAAIATAVDRTIGPAERQEALRLVERFRGKSDALANASAIAWVQRSPDQALRLAAEAAQAGPDNPNALNTLAALLAHAGYEQKAIPLLRYLTQVVPDDPTILSNLGVSWLNLGEVDEAKKILLRCLALAPGHGVANQSAGIIAASEGRQAEAVAHFRRATQSNSSMQARKVLKKQRQTYRSPKGFLGMLPKQEYFSPSAFAPVKAQKLLAEFDVKKAEKRPTPRNSPG